MTERLSDEDLSEIMNYELEPSPEDVSYMAARLIDLRALCCEVYQVVGALAHQADVFSTPEVERAMNNLVAAINGSPLPHETLLPFQVHAAEQGR